MISKSFVAIALMASLSLVVAGFCQESGSNVTSRSSTNLQSEDASTGRSFLSGFTGVTSGTQDGEMPKAYEIQKRIQVALKKLKAADSSSERAEAKSELRSALSEDYDMRLASYEGYLDDLAKKLKNMRERLARRRDAKTDMIDLRIKVLEAEADDLGWPSKMRPGRFPTGFEDGATTWRGSGFFPSKSGTSNRNPSNRARSNTSR